MERIAVKPKSAEDYRYIGRTNNSSLLYGVVEKEQNLSCSLPHR